jgi:hypothetical protein
MTPPSGTTLNAAQCVQRLAELGVILTCYDLFTYGDIHCILEPSEDGALITFPDGSTAYYDDGDYWLPGQKDIPYREWK